MVVSCEEWDFRRLGIKCMVYFYFYGACYWCFCPFQVSTDIVTKLPLQQKEQSVSFCVLQDHTLEQHEEEYIMTENLFMGELFLKEISFKLLFCYTISMVHFKHSTNNK